MRGGARPGAGRKPGKMLDRLEAQVKRIDGYASKLNEPLPDQFKGDAHAFLKSIYKHPALPPKLRIEAAIAAIRFEKPALAATQMTVDDKREPQHFTDAELADIAAGRSAGDADKEEGASRPH